jgi:hypothetical protein
VVRGVLFDVNIEGHQSYLMNLLAALDMTDIWERYGFRTFTVAAFGHTKSVRDRIIWNRCQAERLVLLTENRNDDGEDSLERTMADSLTADSLPVLTLANKGRFEHDRRYALIVAGIFLETLIDAAEGMHRGVGRIYLPPRAIT